MRYFLIILLFSCHPKIVEKPKVNWDSLALRAYDSILITPGEIYSGIPDTERVIHDTIRDTVYMIKMMDVIPEPMPNPEVYPSDDTSTSVLL